MYSDYFRQCFVPSDRDFVPVGIGRRRQRGEQRQELKKLLFSHPGSKPEKESGRYGVFSPYSVFINTAGVFQSIASNFPIALCSLKATVGLHPIEELLPIT